MRPGVHDNGPAAAAERIKAAVGDHACYLTFDIDCLDPAFAPGTGTPVPGGLTMHQAQTILKGLCGVRLVGMDLVEVAPPFDSAEITSLAGAAVMQQMLGVYAFGFPDREDG